MSKRTRAEAPIEQTKKPRLELQEQIKRAGDLAKQLHNAVGKYDSDSRTAANNQIASEELIRIFESMREKTADANELHNTSESVDHLILAQIELEVEKMMAYLNGRNAKSHPLGIEIEAYLTPGNLKARQETVKIVQKRMENVTSGDYVVKIKDLIKEVLREKFLEGVGKKFDGVISGVL